MWHNTLNYWNSSHWNINLCCVPSSLLPPIPPAYSGKVMPFSCPVISSPGFFTRQKAKADCHPFWHCKSPYLSKKWHGISTSGEEWYRKEHRQGDRRLGLRGGMEPVWAATPRLSLLPCPRGWPDVQGRCVKHNGCYLVNRVSSLTKIPDPGTDAPGPPDLKEARGLSHLISQRSSDKTDNQWAEGPSSALALHTPWNLAQIGGTM